MTFRLKKPDPVRELLIDEFDRAVVDDTMGWSEHVYWDGNGKRASKYIADEATRKKIEDEFARLTALPLEKVNALYGALEEKRKKAREEERWFNLAQFRADFSYWGRMPFWTLEEGLILVTGRDPKKVNLMSLSSSDQNHPLFAWLEERLELAKRCVATDQLKLQNSPVTFLAWAKSQKIEIDEALIREVEAKVVLPDNKVTNEASHEVEIETLRAQIAELKSAPPPKGIDPRRVRSMYKIIAASIVENYGHVCGSKNCTTVKDVLDALAEVGLELSEDTVRSIVRKAEQFLPEHSE